MIARRSFPRDQEKYKRASISAAKEAKGFWTLDCWLRRQSAVTPRIAGSGGLVAT